MMAYDYVEHADVGGLSFDQLEQFESKGYVLVNVFSPKEICDFRDMLAPLLRKPFPMHSRLRVFPASEEPLQHLDQFNPYGVWKVFNTPLAGDAWIDFIRHPQILAAVASILGPDLNFHMGFARLRPQGLHADEVWHQDLNSNRHHPPELVTALVYLNEMVPESGATLVSPGSHRRGLLPHTQGDECMVTPSDDEVVPVIAPAGSMLLLHCLTLHRTSTNHTSTNRTVLINQYKSARAVETIPSSAALADMPLWRDGRSV
jgi:hypothetical protein